MGRIAASEGSEGSEGKEGGKDGALGHKFDFSLDTENKHEILNTKVKTKTVKSSNKVNLLLF